MSTGDSFETRFEKIDNLLRDPKSEVNSDCLLVSAAVFSGLPWVAVCSLVNLYESQVCKVLGRCQISLLQEFWSASKSHSSSPTPTPFILFYFIFSNFSGSMLATLNFWF